MEYKEYAFEEGKEVDLKKLQAGIVPREEYVKTHQNVVILCVDIMIWYNGGFLLVQRDNLPVKGELFCIGGRLQRGVPSEKGLMHKVKAECNLDLINLHLLGVTRQFYKNDPFGHGKGTDSFSLVYYAEGVGDIKLDSLHSKPMIIDRNKFEEIRSNLSPFISDFLDLAFKYKKEKDV